MSEQFQGEIVVASRIVDYLSSGLYESPAACLKELINNSYDADAKRVNVFVKPDADRIIIEDDGIGMNKQEFIRHFSRISESHKRESSDISGSGRPKIGKIGIGFIAANEICDVMEIISTKAGSRELLKVAIRFDLMRRDPAERRRGETDIAKGDYKGEVEYTDEKHHYTHLFLKGIRGEARNILAGAGKGGYSTGEISLYGLAPSSIEQKLKDENLRTWSDFDAYSKNRLEVALNVPVPYHDNWMPSRLVSAVEDFQNHVSALGFSLFIDGSEIRKPVVFRENGNSLVRRFDYEGEQVSAHGYFFAQHGAIRPQELQGLLIRIRNAAVGAYDPTFLDFSSSIGPLFQKWISAEIHADDRLEDAMNIDRRTLRAAHPAYVELQRAVHNHLSDLIKVTRSEIYGSGSEERRKESAQKVETRILNVANSEVEQIAPKAAEMVRRAWSEATQDSSGRKRLLRSYTVDELYSIVVEVARETLEPTQFDQFIQRLTERLSK